MRKQGPLKQSLFFKFTSHRSQGVSKRQPHEIPGCPPRQPIINDLHIASLYSDKVLAERQLKDLRVEHMDLQERCTRAESALVIAERDVHKAYDRVQHLPQGIIDRDQYSAVIRRSQNAEQTATAARRKATAAKEVAAMAVRAEREAKAATTAAHFRERELSDRLDTATRRAVSLSARLDTSSARVASLGTEIHGMQTVLNATSKNVRALQTSAAWGEARVAELEQELTAAEEGLELLEDQLTAAHRDRQDRTEAGATDWSSRCRLDHCELGQLQLRSTTASILSTLHRHPKCTDSSWH